MPELTITAYNPTGVEKSPGYRINPVPGTPVSWMEVRNAVGNIITSALYDYEIFIDDAVVSWIAGKWGRLHRVIITFDTSILAGNTIESAILRFYNSHAAAGLNWGSGVLPPWEYNVFAATPVDPENIVATDYQNVGSIPYCGVPKTFNEIAAGYETWQDFHLNDLGISAINTIGYTTLSIRESKYDATGDEPPPTIAEALQDRMGFGGQTSAYIPKLVLTYSEGLPTSTKERVLGQVIRIGPKHFSNELILGGIGEKWSPLTISNEPIYTEGAGTPEVEGEPKVVWMLDEDGVYKMYWLMPDGTLQKID